MNAIVATNIQKAVEKLNNDNASFTFELCGLHPQPVFYGTKQNIICVQSDFFGFYVLSNAIRSLLRGINFIIAASRTLDSGLLAPSVALSYTAAFHGLMAHLALEGHPFFEYFTWAEKRSDGAIVSTAVPKDMLIVSAILNTDNIWSFINRNRNHKVFWRELLPIFANPSYAIPQHYRDLFECLFRGRQKELGVRAVAESIKNPAFREANKLRLEDITDEFLNRIAEVRHTALYEGFGGDPGLVDALLNNDVTSLAGIEHQAVAFYSFSEAMFDHISTDIVDLLSTLNPVVSVRKALQLWFYLRWFDTTLTDDIPGELLKSRIRWIEKWLNEGIGSSDV